MPFETRYLFTASMDVEPEKEAVFNEVYDTEHIPTLLEVPGVISVARFKTRELTMIMGGEARTIVIEGEPRYSALYEIESPDVLTADAWAGSFPELNTLDTLKAAFAAAMWKSISKDTGRLSNQDVSHAIAAFMPSAWTTSQEWDQKLAMLNGLLDDAEVDLLEIARGDVGQSLSRPMTPPPGSSDAVIEAAWEQQ